MGLRCLELSLVSNAAAGLMDGPVDHHEVLAAGKAATAKLHRLLDALLEDSGLQGKERADFERIEALRPAERADDDLVGRKSDPLRKTVLPRQGPVIPRQGPVIPRQGPVIPRQGPAIPRQGPAFPRQGPVVPRQGPTILAEIRWSRGRDQ
jgi:hypothetical protein